MKRILGLLALLVCAPAAHAILNDPFSGFEQRATSTSLLKPFALDLGGLLGASAVDSGRTYGFPGFWVGADMAAQTRPDHSDLILRDANVHSIGLPMVQAGVGLSLYRTGLVDVFLPNVAVSAFGDHVNAGPFGATHAAVNATASWSLPLVKPFIEAGYDLTKISIDASRIPRLGNVSATANGTRLAGGVDLTPFPFVDLRVALLELHGVPGGQLGLGVTF